MQLLVWLLQKQQRSMGPFITDLSPGARGWRAAQHPKQMAWFHALLMTFLSGAVRMPVGRRGNFLNQAHLAGEDFEGDLVGFALQGFHAGLVLGFELGQIFLGVFHGLQN
jgi:hypothetical protein